MQIFNLFKITAKSAPIPTLITAITYTLYPKILESEADPTLRIFISTLIFLVSISILIYSSQTNRSNGKPPIETASKNRITKAKTRKGDIFIGRKGVEDRKLTHTEKNTIKNASSEEGDIFIGTKK